MDYKGALKLADGIKGSLIELGFGKGNSLKEFISYMNAKDIDKRNIWIYESFDGYNEPVAEDEGAFKRGEYKRPPQPAYDIVHTIDREVRLVKGYIEDTLPNNFDKKSVGIVHSHLVSYSSTLHGLDYFKKYLSDNGIIIVSDYNVFPGTKKAVDKFIIDNSPEYKAVETNDDFIAIKKIKIQRFNEKVIRTNSVLT